MFVFAILVHVLNHISKSARENCVRKKTVFCVYVEAKNVEGKPYSRNTMKAIRSGLDRFLSSSPQRKPFSIIRDREFKPANEALDASLKDQDLRKNC